MAFYAQVESTKFIMTKTVSTQLHDNSMRPVLGHDTLHHILEQLVKGIIVHSWFQRNVQWIMFSIISSVLVKSPRSWEKVLTVLMERHWHDSVGQIKCLLNPVSVMDVDIDVNNSWINKQKFQNGQHNIVYVAKTTCLRLFGMMKPSTKIDSDVRLSVQEQCCRIDWSAWRNLAVIIKTIESGTVCWFPDFEFLFFLQKFQWGLLILGKRILINAKTVELVGNVFTNILLEVINVILCMESGHFLFTGVARMINIQFSG